MVKIQGLEKKYSELEENYKREKVRYRNSERERKLYFKALSEVQNPPAFFKALTMNVNVNSLTDILSDEMYSSVEESNPGEDAT